MNDQTPQIKALIACFPQFCKQLDRREVIAYLISKDVLTFQQKSDIEAKGTEYEKNSCLLELLITNANIQNIKTTYDIFIEALNNSKQYNLAEVLLEALEVEVSKIQSQVSNKTSDQLEIQPQRPNRPYSDPNHNKQNHPKKVLRRDLPPIQCPSNEGQNEAIRSKNQDVASDYYAYDQQPRSPLENLLPCILKRNITHYEKNTPPKVLNAAESALKSIYRERLKIVNPFSTTNFTFDVKNSWTPLSVGLSSRFIDGDYEPINDHLQLIERAFNKKNRLLIVQGIAGCGKTSLMYRITYDWRIGSLKSYKFVFYISVYQIRDQKFATIADMIETFFKGVSDDKDIALITSELKKGHFRARDRTLVILDGYEEAYHQGSCAELTNFLEGPDINRKPLPFNVIVTSRPGHFCQYLNRSGILSSAIVCGFESSEQKEHYIRRLATNKQDEIQKCIQYIGIIPEIAQTPLFLASIFVVFRDKGERKITNYQLYRTIIWLLIDRFQRDHPDDNVPQLFGFDTQSRKDFSSIIEKHFHQFPLFRRLGIMAFELFSKDHFEKSDLEAYGINMTATENILTRVGLLRQENCSDDAILTFPHVTFRSFLAGGVYYFWHDYRKDSGPQAIFSKDSEQDNRDETKELKIFVRGALLLMEDSQIDWLVKNSSPTHTISLDLFLFVETENCDSVTCNIEPLNKILSKCSALKEICLYYSSSTIRIQQEINLEHNVKLKSLRFLGTETNRKTIHFEAKNSKSIIGHNASIFVKLPKVRLEKIEFHDVAFHNELCFNTTMSHVMEWTHSCLLSNCDVYFREGKRVDCIKSIGSALVPSASDDNPQFNQRSKYEKYTKCLQYLSSSNRIVMHAAENKSRYFHAEIVIPSFRYLKSFRLERFDFSEREYLINISPDTFKSLETLEYLFCLFKQDALSEMVTQINDCKNIIRIAFLGQLFESETFFMEFLGSLQKLRFIKELEIQVQCIGPETNPVKCTDATDMFCNLAKQITSLNQLTIWINCGNISLNINKHQLIKSVNREVFIVNLI